MTTFRQLYLKGKSITSNNPTDLLQEHYDLGIFSSSWDRRSIVLCNQASIQLRQSLLLLPHLRDLHGLRDKHDDILKKFCEARSKSVKLVASESNIPEATWANIYELFSASTGFIPPFDRVLIDLSAAPRYYTLGLVAMLLRFGLVKTIDIFYAEAIYEPKDHPDSIIFTRGLWQKRAIPFLGGIGNPALPSTWLISTGFEGLQTLRLLRKEEPDRIGLLVPIPGFTDDYETRTKREADQLCEEFEVQPKEVLYAHAADAIAAWEKIVKEPMWAGESEQISYVCGGTKPHSLALTLHSLISRRPAVYYVKPDARHPADVYPSGKHWLFRIEDLSKP